MTTDIKVRVVTLVGGEMWMDAHKLLSAMGVEVCATTVSELSAENAQYAAENARLHAQVVGYGDAKRALTEHNAYMARRNDALLAQVDELTQTVANRDDLIAQQTDTIQRIMGERDEHNAVLRNVQRVLNGDGLLP
jgi:cell division protein FtsB